MGSPLDALYEKYDALIRRQIRGRINDDTAREDVLQDIWLAIVRGRNRQPSGNISKEWVFGVVHNTLVNHYIRGRRESERFVMGLDFEPSAVAPAAYLRSHLACETSIHTWLSLALAQLSARDKALLHSLCVVGDAQAELAQRLGVPIGLIRGRIHRARARFFAALDVSLRRRSTKGRHESQHEMASHPAAQAVTTPLAVANGLDAPPPRAGARTIRRGQARAGSRWYWRPTALPMPRWWIRRATRECRSFRR